MKKIVLAFYSLLFLSLLASAQIKKGSTFIGGSLGFSNSNQKTTGSMSIDGKQKSLYFGPAVGKAIKENFVAGINLYYTYSKGENYYQSNNVKTESVGGGFFLRRYFSVANKFYLFGQTGAGFSSTKGKEAYTASNIYQTKTNGWSAQVNLAPGLSYNIFKALHLEMSFENLIGLAYFSQNSTHTDNLGNTTKRESRGFSLQSNATGNAHLNVGVRFIIPKK